MTWCDYAACDQPGPHQADGWHFCRPHLRAHEQLDDSSGDKALDLAARRRLSAYRRSQVARFWRKGWNDAQIARSLGIHRNTVRLMRRSLGLPTRLRAAQCGTRSGYSRHRSRGEQPCAACRQAQSDYDAHYFRLRKRTAA